MTNLSRSAQEILDAFQALEGHGLQIQLAAVICAATREAVPLSLGRQRSTSPEEALEWLVEARCRAEIKSFLLEIAEELALTDQVECLALSPPLV